MEIREVILLFWLFFPIFRRSCAGEVEKYLSEVVFGVEADHTTYSGDGVITVFELLDCDIYSYRV